MPEFYIKNARKNFSRILGARASPAPCLLRLCLVIVIVIIIYHYY